MSAVTQDSRFLRRFDALWLRIRRVRLGQTLALAGLASLLGLASLIAADYLWELPRAVRAAGLTLVGVLSLASIAGLLRLYVTSGSKPRTAAEVERAFPKLGQSVRTVVQFGSATRDEVKAAGVWESLVVALEEETHARSRPLYLDSVVPIGGLRFAIGGLLIVTTALLGALAINWEWRVAAQRVALVEVPYTEFAVTPGNVRVDHGDAVDLSIAVSGRTHRKVTLLTRPAGDATSEWTEREFGEGEATATGPFAVAFAATLEGVKRPLEYRAVIGDSATEIFRVDVRMPIAIQRVDVELTPPAYTNQPPVKSEDANINAVEGTVATIAITFDQSPQTAALVLTDLRRLKDDEEPTAPQTLPLKLNGAVATGSLEIVADMKYSIVAETEDALRLAANSYRIRVRPDQAPEVYFEAPEDGIEVHTLAEILMRIRIRDDFGISKAGIIFEVNNEEEYPLLAEEFAITREDLDAQGKLSPETNSALEKMLPLEYFELKQTDSVAYYAYAEDNYPGRSHRTVTDLRFIDIRPFRIRYAVRDDDPANGGGTPGPDVATLGELIKRQRLNLNRTMNLDRKAEREEKIDLSLVDAVVTSEAELAQSTRELADFLGNLMIDVLEDEIQLLLLAEANMLAAVDSLSAGKYGTAVLQERDALKELIEGRNRLRVEIQKNPRRFRSLAAADRRMVQKLRRPKSDAEEAAEVVRRLRQLASEQQGLQANMMAQANMPVIGEPQPQDPESPAPAGSKTEPAETSPDAPKTKGESAEKTNPPNEGEGPAKGSDQPGDAPQPGADTGSETMSREELADKQLDNVLEAQDLEQALGKLKNITDLAKERMASAREGIEGANTALERGDTPKAVEQSEEAVGTLDELARQVEALIKEEAAERLNAARQMAMQLAQKQQELAMNTPSPNSAGGKAGTPTPEETEKQANAGGAGEQPNDDPGEKDKPAAGAGEGADAPQSPEKTSAGTTKSDEPAKDGSGLAEDLADIAEQNAAAGATILDLLQSIQRSTNPADKDVIGRVDSLMNESRLEETVARMGGLADQLRSEDFAGAGATAADSADRLEIVAQRLNSTFLELTAPKLENLMELERKLQELRERLEQLETERDVVGWHRDAAELLKKLSDLNVGADVRKELEDLMKAAGWSPDVDQFRLNPAAGWVYSNEELRFGAAPGYVVKVEAMAREVQNYIQELILDDMRLGAADAVPPQYEELVERYYEVLAKQQRTSMP